jgi:hypothetical protein
VAVIFFDGDQTLWDFQGLMRWTLAATIDELRRLEPTVEGDLSSQPSTSAGEESGSIVTDGSLPQASARMRSSLSCAGYRC